MTQRLLCHALFTSCIAQSIAHHIHPQVNIADAETL
jgi:hypothetical protein